MSNREAHPSHEQLAAYQRGQLSPDDQTQIEGHVNECNECGDTLVAMSSQDTFVGMLQAARQCSHDDRDGIEASLPKSVSQHPRYEIEALIGKGGMGDVYKAMHRVMDRPVALKVIRPSLVRRPEVVDRFAREAKAAAQLSHPNIVAAFDAEHEADVHFLVMEYVTGTDLARLVREKGKLPVGEAADYIRQAALGLNHAHEHQIIHRDIKPHNLMLTAEGTVKILDFGLASLTPLRADTMQPPESERGDLTATRAVVGTPDYLSPEQATDARTVDIRSDLYSLGATFYHLLAGEAPFAGASIPSILKKHAEAEPPSLETSREDVPEELAAIINKMLAKDPEDRFDTPLQVANALTPFCISSASGDDREGKSFRKSQSWWSIPRVAAACVALALLVGVGAAMALSPPKSKLRVQVADPTLQVQVGDALFVAATNESSTRVTSGRQDVSVRNPEGRELLQLDPFWVNPENQVSIQVRSISPNMIAVTREIAAADDAQNAADPATDSSDHEFTETIATLQAELARETAEAGSLLKTLAEAQDAESVFAAIQSGEIGQTIFESQNGAMHGVFRFNASKTGAVDVEFRARRRGEAWSLVSLRSLSSEFTASKDHLGTWRRERTVAIADTDSRVTLGGTTSHVIETSDTGGLPDYIAAVNQTYGQEVSEANNAAPTLWYIVGPKKRPHQPSEAFLRKAAKASTAEYFAGLYDYLGAESPEPLSHAQRKERIQAVTGAPWKASDYPLVAQWLESQRPALDLVREACRREKYMIPHAEAPGVDMLKVYNELLSGLPILRSGEIAEGLVARAMLRVGEGEQDQAWQDLVSCHRLGRLLTQGPGLTSDLLPGVAAIDVAVAGEKVFLEAIKPADAARERYARDLQDLPLRRSLLDRVDYGERWSVLAALLQLAGADNDGKDQLLQGLGIETATAESHAGVDWSHALRLVNREFDAIITAFSEQDPTRRARLVKQIEDRLLDHMTSLKEDPSILKAVGADESGFGVTRHLAYTLLGMQVPGILGYREFELKNLDAERQIFAALSVEK